MAEDMLRANNLNQVLKIDKRLETVVYTVPPPPSLLDSVGKNCQAYLTGLQSVQKGKITMVSFSVSFFCLQWDLKKGIVRPLFMRKQ